MPTHAVQGPTNGKRVVLGILQHLDAGGHWGDRGAVEVALSSVRRAAAEERQSYMLFSVLINHLSSGARSAQTKKVCRGHSQARVWRDCGSKPGYERCIQFDSHVAYRGSVTVKVTNSGNMRFNCSPVSSICVSIPPSLVNGLISNSADLYSIGISGAEP